MPPGIYKRTKQHLKNMKIAQNRPNVKERNKQTTIEQWQSGSFDDDVKKRSKRMKGNQYAKGHRQTEDHKNKIGMANSGKNSSSYKDGRTLKKYYCIDCKKKLGQYTAKRCVKCNSKFMWKAPEYRKKNKTNLGNKASDETKRKLRNGLDRHHIYLDNDNDKILILTGQKHRQLHARGYDYLVKIGKIDDYIKWFDKKYNLVKREGVK